MLIYMQFILDAIEIKVMDKFVDIKYEILYIYYLKELTIKE